MDGGVTINLTRRGLKYSASETLRQTEHVNRAMHRGLGRLHRIMLIVNWRRRAGQVVDLVDLNIEGKGHVVTDYLKIPVAQEVLDIPLRAGKKVIEAKHLMPLRQEPLTQMRA
jgi:hypothetical protein